MFLLKSDFWEVKKTHHKGRGVFAKKKIPKGTLIGDYVGKLIQLEDVDFAKERKNLYLMYYDDKLGIYPDLKKPGVHLLNHSCFPNCWIYKLKGHTLVFALTNIEKGKELTISYLLPPKTFCNKCPHRCHCESKNCTKTMHLSEEKYKTWQDFQSQNQNNEKVLSETSKGGDKFRPLLKYPKRISENYITKIKKLGII